MVNLLIFICMKTVGIIGGLGPETTSQFYLQLILKYKKINLRKRPPILLWSIPMDLAIEEDLIKRNKGTERYLPYLIDAAQRLEKGGADFLVIPCNSVHIFIKEIRAHVKIPVLSIVEETISYLNKNNINKVLLLATTSTVKNNLYQRLFEEKNIIYRIPDEKNQIILSNFINDIVNAKASQDDTQKLMILLSKLHPERDESILLACTDLQIVLKKNVGYTVYDTMQILLESTIREIGI
jgi:aspartate racemase